MRSPVPIIPKDLGTTRTTHPCSLSPIPKRCVTRPWELPNVYPTACHWRSAACADVTLPSDGAVARPVSHSSTTHTNERSTVSQRTSFSTALAIMLVPRSFRYAAGSEKGREVFDEKMAWSAGGRRTSSSSVKSRSPVRTAAAAEPVVSKEPTKPVAVPTPQPDRQHNARTQSLAVPQNRGTRRPGGKRMPASHDPESLPPSVAALLAVTQIPRPKPHQVRRRRASQKQVSIDELVNEWKNDVPLSPSYGSSPALSMLLEEQDETEWQSRSMPEGHARDYLHSRTTSEDSVPSLDNDDKSLLSLASPPTPEFSLRSRRSMSNIKKEKSRSLPTTEDCGLDHPLVPSLSTDDPDEDIMLSPPESARTPPKSKGRFTSNLTLSLQALKNAAITKISSLGTGSSSPSQRTPSSPLSDDVLWSHPFLFPRFSPEVRPPNMKTPPTKAERRYLNPLPLTFEEQEAPYQQALHAPYLAEEIAEAPTIQMQTYHRGRRKSGSGGKKQQQQTDPSSEAGRALAVGVKVREPRENGDFLRVVVLEMNMRRVGKLENGRARMWLPPRQGGQEEEDRGKGVPVRWRGVSAY